MNDPRRENLGPADRIITQLLTYTDHLVHNRPGIVSPDPTKPIGVKWTPATTKLEQAQRVVYRLEKQGKKSVRVRVGVLQPDNRIVENGRPVGHYLKPTSSAPGANPFPQVAAYLYRQIAEVYKLDAEFSARWASWAYNQDNRDLKVVLAAFMLVQPKKGDPVREGGEVLFYDDDFRDVGEAMCLISRKDKKDLDAKLLLRVGKILRLPEVAQINRELGLSRAKRPYMGRWPKAVEKWLRYREENPRLLAGLVKAGFKQTVRQLAREIGYKASSDEFYRVLGWKQKQSEGGHRTQALGLEFAPAETWAGLSEREICQRILKEGRGWKVISGMLPPEVGMTRAIVAASVEANALSDADLIIMTPTLEELGLLGTEPVKSRWEKANQNATNQRAVNIAKRVHSKEISEKLEATASKVVEKVAEETSKGLVLYVLVDCSGSMTDSIEHAIEYLSRFIGGWPLKKLHVAVFDTSGRVIEIKHASRKGVEHAFAGRHAGGGTDYSSGIRAIQHLKPPAGEDAFILYVGDNDPDSTGMRSFAPTVRASGLNPVAFGLLEVGRRLGRVVDITAAELQIPVLRVDKEMFATEDPYAITRMLRNLIAAAPVGVQAAVRTAPARESLIDIILKTPLLEKPVWA